MTPSTDTEKREGDAATPSLDVDELRACYRTMLVVRRFEEEVQRQFQQGRVLGTTHLCIGQEAVSAGIEAALGGDDVVAATYRGHGQALARGVPTAALAAEMLGRATGICGGRAGSMNVVDLSRNLVGCFGIIGGTLATSIGVGLAAKGTGRVAVAYFGDGTTNHGYFHECLNFAKVLQLPVLFVCENNGYGEFTPWQQVTAGPDLLGRARVFDIPAAQADGMDVRDVHRIASPLIDRARAGDGPQFIECVTYRFVGHSRSDPGAYRPPGELDEWKRRDPLLIARTALSQEFDVAEDELSATEKEAAELVTRAFKSALAGPPPDLNTPISAYANA